MFRIMMFFVSGLLSFCLVGTVVAQQLAGTALEIKPVLSSKPDMPTVHQMSGTVQEVDLVSNTIRIKNRRGEKSFSVTPETQFKKGRAHLKGKLTEFKAGTKVVVKYWERDGVRQASLIKLK